MSPQSGEAPTDVREQEPHGPHDQGRRRHGFSRALGAPRAAAPARVSRARSLRARRSSGLPSMLDDRSRPDGHRQASWHIVRGAMLRGRLRRAASTAVRFAVALRLAPVAASDHVRLGRVRGLSDRAVHGPKACAHGYGGATEARINGTSRAHSVFHHEKLLRSGLVCTGARHRGLQQQRRRTCRSRSDVRPGLARERERVVQECGDAARRRSRRAVKGRA